MLGRYKAEVGFPRGQGDETTVGIPAREVGGSPPSDWGTVERVAAWTVGESVGKPGNREDEAVRSGSFGRLGN